MSCCERERACQQDKDSGQQNASHNAGLAVSSID
jgi:hypothetical protein